MGEEKYMKVLSIGKRYGADGIVPRLYNMDIYNLISIYQNDVLHGVRICRQFWTELEVCNSVSGVT